MPVPEGTALPLGEQHLVALRINQPLIAVKRVLPPRLRKKPASGISLLTVSITQNMSCRILCALMPGAPDELPSHVRPWLLWFKPFTSTRAPVGQLSQFSGSDQCFKPLDSPKQGWIEGKGLFASYQKFQAIHLASGCNRGDLPRISDDVVSSQPPVSPMRGTSATAVTISLGTRFQAFFLRTSH
jgi:hypothetical protein